MAAAPSVEARPHPGLRLARTSLVVALFLSMVAFSPGLLDAFGLPKLAAVWVFGLLAMAGLVAACAAGSARLPRPRLRVPAVVLLIVTALATVFSIAPLISLRGMHERYDGLLSLAVWELLALVVVALHWERPSRLRSITVVFSIAAALVAAYVVLQALRLDPIGWGTTAAARAAAAQYNAGRPGGPIGNANFAGATLAVTLPFGISLAMGSESRRRRAAWLALVSLEGVAMWLTKSRGALVGGLTGLAVLAFVHRRRFPIWTRKAFGVALLAVGVTAAALVVSGTTIARGPAAEVLNNRTLVQRWAFWQGAIGVFAENPVLGTGPDTFYASYGPHRPAGDGAAHGLFEPPDKPHNVYLEYAAETGALGLAAYLSLIGLAIAYAVSRLRSLEGSERALLGAFLAVLAAYLAQAAFSLDVLPLPVIAWTSLAAIAVLADPAHRKSPGQPWTPGPVARQAMWVAAAALVALTAVAAVPLLGDRAAKLGQRAGDAGHYTEAERLFSRAIAIDSHEANYSYLLGIAKENLAGSTDADHKRAFLEQALGRYRKAQQLMPYNPFFQLAFARASTTFAGLDPQRFADADRAWRAFAEHDPTNWELRALHARMLNAWADAGGPTRARLEAALEQRTVTRMRPLDRKAWLDLRQTYLKLGRPDAARQAAQRARQLSGSTDTSPG